MSKYNDIIEFDYQMKHPRMSINNRSAQFAPFSALTGYEELIIEKGRITEPKQDLSFDDKELLDLKIQLIKKYISKKPKIKVTYFIKDLKKDGGKHITSIDNIKKIDFTKQLIILSNNLKIKIDDIIEIDSQDINFNDII